MKILFSFASILFCSVLAFATPQKGFMKLSDGVERYVEYTEPQAGKPWIVFTNGLVYELERWGQLDEKLTKQGYGILHYYFRGQDLTLKRETEQFPKPLFFQRGLESKDFAKELHEILNVVGIKDKVIVVGLSFGSHIAASFAESYPQSVEEVVFMAPLVVPLEKYNSQGMWLELNLQWSRMIWGPYFYEYAYRQIYEAYLGKRVTADNVPEHLREIPEFYRESLFHLVRTVRDFDLKDYNFSKLEKNSVFFMVAQEEEPKAFADQLAAFERVDKKAQGSLIWLPDASHAIPDSAPTDAAYYLNYLIGRDSRLEQGAKYKNTSQGLKAW